jgi:hypothetical protein
LTKQFAVLVGLISAATLHHLGCTADAADTSACRARRFDLQQQLRSLLHINSNIPEEDNLNITGQYSQKMNQND